MQSVLANPSRKNDISNELSDVLIYCFGFSDVLGIDISEAVRRKLQKNGDKYPVVDKLPA